MNVTRRAPARRLLQRRPVEAAAATDNGTVTVDGPVGEERAQRAEAVPDQLASWFLRAGLAFVFSYAAVSSFLHPVTFARYFPSFLPASWATELLPVFAVYEMLLVVGFLTRRYTYAAAVLSALTLSAIILMNPDAFEVLFRNVAIACGALALAVQTRRWAPDPGVGQPALGPGDTLAGQLAATGAGGGCDTDS